MSTRHPADELEASLPYADPSFPTAYDEVWMEGTEESRVALRLIRGIVFRRGADSWLDGACGAGWHLRNAGLRLGRMVGADRSATMLAHARKHDSVGAEFVQCDLRDMGQLGQFDLVTSFYFGYIHQPTLHDVRACLDGLADAVAPGGTLLLAVCNPMHVFWRLPYSECYGHSPHPLTFDAVIWSWTENPEKGWVYEHNIVPHIELIQSWFQARFERVRLINPPSWGMQGPGFICERGRSGKRRAAAPGGEAEHNPPDRTTTPATDLAAVLEALGPAVPAALLDGEFRERLGRAAARFPVMIDECRIDFRLDDPTPEGGIAVTFRPGSTPAQLAASAFGTSLAPAAGDTLRRLASDSLGLSVEVGRLVLACGDVGLADVSLEAAADTFGNPGLLAWLLARLADRPDRREMRHAIERVFAWTEQNGQGCGAVRLAGVSPGQNDSGGCHIRIDDIAAERIPDALAFLRWPGDAAAVTASFPALPLVARTDLSFQITPEGPTPRLGVELHPHRGWPTSDPDAWRALLAALASARLAIVPGKLSALGDVFGTTRVSLGEETWTLQHGGSHVTLYFSPDGVQVNAHVGLRVSLDARPPEEGIRSSGG